MCDPHNWFVYVDNITSNYGAIKLNYKRRQQKVFLFLLRFLKESYKSGWACIKLLLNSCLFGCFFIYFFFLALRLAWARAGLVIQFELSKNNTKTKRRKWHPSTIKHLYCFVFLSFSHSKVNDVTATFI